MKGLRLFALLALCLFAVLGGLAWRKKQESLPQTPSGQSVKSTASSPLQKSSTVPQADRIDELFSTCGKKLPFVETITYTAHASWLPGKPAWVSDYSSHFATSRHFIARSLNRKRDYVNQAVKEGDRFNVFKKEHNVEFYLVVDLSQCKMLMYAYDARTQERTHLKTYSVVLGRISKESKSGSLTPAGRYKLGDRVAIYGPGDKGYFQHENTEMIRVFGTRWIPFEKEIGECTAPAKGLGIHGSPWTVDSKTGKLVEDKSCTGTWASDGCIRLATDDMEELFAIVITKPTTVEIVPHYNQAHLPGK